LISNRKPEHRKGKVQLIDATGMGSSMRKNEGNKRKFIDQNSIDEISRIYADFEESPVSKIFDYTDFGYRRVKVLRPLRIDLVFDAEKLNTFKDQKSSASYQNPIKMLYRLILKNSSVKVKIILGLKHHS
jgi:type I restriction enzyme M protein